MLIIQLPEKEGTWGISTTYSTHILWRFFQNMYNITVFIYLFFSYPVNLSYLNEVILYIFIIIDQ